MSGCADKMPIKTTLLDKWPVIVAVLVVWRACLLGEQSLWRDEIYSASASTTSDSFSVLLHNWLLTDVHPPLFNTLLFGWHTLGFQSDAALRALPFLISTALLVTAVLWMRRWLGRTGWAWYSLLLFGIPGITWYSMELRAYSLVYALAALSLPAVFQLRDELLTTLKASTLVIWLLITLAGCLLHFFYFAFAGAQAFALALCLARQRNFSSLLLIASIFLLAALPLFSWLYFHSEFLLGKSGGNFWIKNRVFEILTDFYALFFGRLPQFLYPLLILVSILLAALCLFGKSERSMLKSLQFPLSILGIFFVGIVAVSYHTPIITGRNLLVSVPLLLFCLACLFDQLDTRQVHSAASRVLYGLLLFIFIFAFAMGLYSPFSQKKEQWREASAYINEHYSSDDCLIPVRPWFEGSTKRGIDLYYRYYLSPEKHERLVNYHRNQPDCDLLLFSYVVNYHKDEQRMRDASINFRVVQFHKLRVYEKVRESLD